MLAPTLSLQIGDAVYEQATRVRLRRGLLPIVDRLEVVLPAATEFSAAPGDDVSLELDGGEGGATVFTGKLAGVQHSVRSLRVLAYGPAFELARARPAGAYEKLDVQEIFERLTEDLDVSLDVREADIKTALFVCEGRATALESIVRLCGIAGLQAAFAGDGTLAIGPDGPGDAVALRYGRELLDVASTTRWADDSEFVIVGEGGGSPDSDQSLWIAQDFFAGGRTAAGTGVRWRSEPLVREVDDARTAAAAWTGTQRRREAPIRMLAWLLPAVAPGSTIEVQDLPEHLSLPKCMVRQVIHELDPRRGARSSIWACADEGGGLAGLAGLIGGLL